MLVKTGLGVFWPVFERLRIPVSDAVHGRMAHVVEGGGLPGMARFLQLPLLPPVKHRDAGIWSVGKTALLIGSGVKVK